jgi:hypothetical protein
MRVETKDKGNQCAMLCVRVGHPAPDTLNTCALVIAVEACHC